MSTERQPVSFNKFGGLRLDLPLDQVPATQAIDMLDVEVSLAGVLRVRPGAVQVPTSSPYINPFPHDAQTLLVMDEEENLAAIFKSGLVAKEQATGIEGSFGFRCARLGTPSGGRTYIGFTSVAGSTASTGIWVYNGSTFSEPTATVDGVTGKAMPTGAPLAVWPEAGDRLVVAGPLKGPNGAASSNSHVWFSEPEGKAESYSATATTDPSKTMEPRWQSGFYDLGSEDEKELLGVRAFGTGTVDAESFSDLGEEASASEGHFEFPAEGAGTVYDENALTDSGVMFSHKLSLEPGSRIQRLVRYLRETRTPGTES